MQKFAMARLSLSQTERCNGLRQLIHFFVSMTCKEQCKSEKKLWEDPNELASDHCKVNECKNEQECVDAGCYWDGICYTHMTCDIVADCTLFFPFNLFCAGAFGAEIVVDSLALIFILDHNWLGLLR